MAIVSFFIFYSSPYRLDSDIGFPIAIVFSYCINSHVWLNEVLYSKWSFVPPLYYSAYRLSEILSKKHEFCLLLRFSYTSTHVMLHIFLYSMFSNRSINHTCDLIPYVMCSLFPTRGFISILLEYAAKLPTAHRIFFFTGNTSMSSLASRIQGDLEL